MTEPIPNTSGHAAVNGGGCGAVEGSPAPHRPGMDPKAFAEGGNFLGLLWFYRDGMTTPVVAALNDSALAVALTNKLMRERRWGEPDETATVFPSADAMEGARTIAERRPPVWSGR